MTAGTPRFVVPMTAKLALEPPAGDWLYEIKLDGFRALALLGASTRLVSRNEKDFVERFPEIVDALTRFPVRDTVLDGEVVALDANGRSSFTLLGDRSADGGHAPLLFYVFDVLRWDGHDVTAVPLEGRKELLRLAFEKLRVDPCIRFSDSISSDGHALLRHAEALGLEGLIGKRIGSRYEIGRRSDAWIKLKLQQQQELVIGGYSDPEGSRTGFGALLVGFYQDGALLHAGSVGSGFDENTLRALSQELFARARPTCPFSNLPEPARKGRVPRMTRAEMTRCHWVEPELVCQVRFTAWTRDDHLRNPVFLGLRPDKRATDVVREGPVDRATSRAR